MELKQIFTYQLMDFLNEFDNLREQGYVISEALEHYPAFINGGFFCMMKKTEQEQTVTETTEETTSTTVVEKKPRGRRSATV